MQGAGRPIRAFHKGAGTVLPSLLLGSKLRRRFLGRINVHFQCRPQNTIKTLVDML
jgi:hypothetical protein